MPKAIGRLILVSIVALSGLGCGASAGTGDSLLGRSSCAIEGPIAEGERQILFGDLHVHSTFSLDARAAALPLTAGPISAGPAERCDFARYCSQVDFWSINDHPEQQLPRQWLETIDAIRVCNDLEGGYSAQPSMVSFLGWEWTSGAGSPADEYGHKNVVLKDTCDDQIPKRPIAAPSDVPVSEEAVSTVVELARGLDPEHEPVYVTFGEEMRAALAVPNCPFDTDSRELPLDCREVARDPHELYQKLDQWGVPTLVIPHGTTWGSNHAANTSWRAQLNRRQYDPRYERLIEVVSGHGNSEEYRTFEHVRTATDGSSSCPEPSASFEPCCWRAGEIARTRSSTCAGAPESLACRAEIEQARQSYVDAGMNGVSTQPGATPEEWLDCGQCRDCFEPSFTYRPRFSVQAALALTDFEDPLDPLRFELGFVGSTDSHRAGAGAGYKEFRAMSDNVGSAREDFDWLVTRIGRALFGEFERQNSFYYAGALVAVHARGRDRGSIWDALEERNVYATSGERILLWFDLINGPTGERLPMGSRAQLSEAPRFEVRAVGAFHQAPGCPEEIKAAAGQARIDALCFGECYNPTDERQLITRIEIVKIQPQISADEDLASLISDPFVTLPCEPDPEGCRVSFVDEGFVGAGRPAVYYARAIQEPTLQLNAGGLRCDKDPSGQCRAVHLCPAGYRAEGDDCLTQAEERAWASPIYVTP